ncbi:MAG: peptidyl-prolyl cis-trans isomerase [Phycisphaerales bacterium]|nr:MAG: peptidyl-prolyl cis-trans isomerase [Phycisphaerales bacterium]
MNTSIQMTARLALLLASTTLVACASDSHKPDLSYTDFQNQNPDRQQATTTKSTTNASMTIVGPSIADEGVVDVTASAGPPALSNTPAPMPGTSADGVLIDVIVGDINGRQIAAKSFFVPMADRLRATAQDPNVSLEQWRKTAIDTIGKELVAIVRDELVRADAMAKLTPEMKSMLSLRVSMLADERASKHGGSALRAERMTGVSEQTQRKRDESELLVRKWIQEEIRSKIQITDRDVRLYYEKNNDKYQPPKTYVFRHIVVPAARAENVSSIQSMIDSNIAVDQIASSDLNLNSPSSGAIEERKVPGDRAEAKFYNTESLNTVAREIPIGQWSPPIFNDGYTEWLYLERIDGKSISYEEAQGAIRQFLEAQAFAEAQDLVVKRMMERGNYTAIDTMGQRLLEIAEDWYYKPYAAPKPRRNEAASR